MTIRTVNDFFPEDLYNRTFKTVDETPLKYGWKSNNNTDPHGHWNVDIAKRGAANLSDMEFMLTGVYKEVWDYMRANLPELEDTVPIRCYVNAHTYGTDGWIHSDSKRDDETTIVIYMVKDKWDADWGGETVFIDKDGDIEKSVLPKRNRISVFIGNQLHGGRALSRACMIKRTVLVYKTRKRRSPEFEKLSSFLTEVGTLNTKHAIGSLHDHLCRVYDILLQKGFDSHVCLGGGLHSIYGTNALKVQTLSYDSRDIVKELFGEKAENLAYLFSVVNRPKALENARSSNGKIVLATNDGKEIEVDSTTYRDLLRIEAANLIDQDSINMESHPVIMGSWL